MAAAGLWTTPTDLAKWLIAVSDAWNGRPSKLLSASLATQMLTMQYPPYGLGPVLRGTDRSFRFGHTGANLGFRAEVEMYPSIGKGAVVMTNADLGGSLMSEILLSIAAEYDWPARRQIEREMVLLEPHELDRVVGIYTVAGPFGPVAYEVSREGDRLFDELKGVRPRSELFASGVDTFFSLYGNSVVFTPDSSGRVVQATLGGQLEAVRKN
jgi:CubicO group peptidase (beta-lactamase class C family)